MNVHKPADYALAANRAAGRLQVPFTASHPKMFTRWLALASEAIYCAPR
jgi:hypothetical protein